MSKKFRTEIMGIDVEYDTIEELTQKRDEIIANRKDAFCNPQDHEDTEDEESDDDSEHDHDEAAAGLEDGPSTVESEEVVQGQEEAAEEEEEEEESEVKTLTWKTDLVDITATEGEAVGFKVEVNEEADVTYKLFKDGTDTQKSNKDGEFSLESAELSENGTKFYILAVADGYEQLKSKEATYTVNAKSEEVDPDGEGVVTMEEVDGDE